ncbi:MAG: RNA polymerase sigma factor [Oscillospiraceae bacterium]
MTEERKLAAGIKSGDMSALERAIDGLSGYVLTVVRNFSRGYLSPQDMEEAVQDTFVALWNSRNRLYPETGLKPYISAIARNMVKNRLRSMKPTEDISELELPSDFDVAARAEMSELLSCMNDGLKTLTADDRAVFLRFYFYGEKTAVISEVMGLNDSTVRSKLTRIRQKLKKYMTERGFENV